MCDYSLERVATRAAVKGDRLVTTEFANSITRGFASVDDRRTAVCLMPGTELVFDSIPRVERFLLFWAKRASSRTARFRQLNKHEPRCHHDALEFSDGTTVLLAKLTPGQSATVIQRPREEVRDVRRQTERSEGSDGAVTLAKINR